jgi:transcriptional regulator with XRE-family HTH domain
LVTSVKDHLGEFADISSMNTEHSFGQLLRGIREKKKMTQQALADASGLSRVQIARLETDVQSPSWETVKILCRTLGVDCDAFMARANKSAMPSREKKGRTSGGS